MKALFVAVFVSLVVPVSAASNFSRTSWAASSSSYSKVGRPLVVSISATAPGTFYYSFDGTNYLSSPYSSGLSQLQLSAGLTVLNDATSGNYGMISAFSWSGLSASSGTVVGNSQEVNKTVSFRWASSGNVGTFVYTIPACTLDVSYSASANTYVNFNYASQNQNLTAGSLVAPAAAGARAQLTLQIYNFTGATQTIPFGTQSLTLVPGMNEIRYDGPVDGNGIPTDCSSDFVGVAWTGSDGRKYVSAEIVSTGGDNEYIKWGNMVVPPSTAGDVITMLNPGDSTHGPVVLITRPDGGKIITQLPAPYQDPGGMTVMPANTTGGGAVISDPTKPPPATTTGGSGSVTNNNNNTVNNTNTTNNTTNIINNPPVDVSGPSMTYVDGEMGENANTKAISDFSGDGSKFGPSSSASAAKTSALGAGHDVVGKISGAGMWMDKLGTPAGDYTGFDLPLGHGTVAHVNLPLNNVSINWFRNCCLFAFYLMATFKAMKILRV